MRKTKSTAALLVKFTEQNELDTPLLDCFGTTPLAKKLVLKKKLPYAKAQVFEASDYSSSISDIIQEINENPHVHYAQLNTPLYPCTLPKEPHFDKQWGLYNNGQVDAFGHTGVPGLDINIAPVWDHTMGSEDVLVGVLDSIVDIDHLDLSASIYTEALLTKGSYDSHDKEGSMTCLAKAKAFVKEAKHGTQVSGVIAASCNNRGIIGVAPGVKLVPLSFMSKSHGLTADAIEAIEYAQKLGIRIVNCSWGDYQYNPALEHHIRNSTMLFVCAAGNRGLDIAKTPFYPASFDLPNVITVGALNSRGKLWTMSNYGLKVHLAAPGTSIYTTTSSLDKDSYTYNSGTSLAAPFVTGAAALLVSLNKKVTAEEIKKRILSTTTPLEDLKDKTLTGGLLNAAKSVLNQ